MERTLHAYLQSGKPAELLNLKTKIKKAKKTIAKLVKRVPGSEIVHLKKRRLAGLECRLKQREADRKSCRVRLCFGSRKLFHAQFDLQANGLRSHEEWLARWREKRSNQFFVLGSKDETGRLQSEGKHSNLRFEHLFQDGWSPGHDM